MQSVITCEWCNFFLFDAVYRFNDETFLMATFNEVERIPNSGYEDLVFIFVLLFLT